MEQKNMQHYYKIKLSLKCYLLLLMFNNCMVITFHYSTNNYEITYIHPAVLFNTLIEINSLTSTLPNPLVLLTL